jgi:hypothetical protein
MPSRRQDEIGSAQGFWRWVKNKDQLKKGKKLESF